MRFTYFHGWLMQIISELSRTLKSNGVLFLNIGSTPDWEDKLMPLDILLFEDLRRSGLTFQSRVIWTTPHGLTPKRRLAERHETVLVFSKGDAPTFNPSAARIPQKQPGKRAFKGPTKASLVATHSGPILLTSDISQTSDTITQNAKPADRIHTPHSSHSLSPNEPYCSTHCLEN
jgi:hypothetical protein